MKSGPTARDGIDDNAILADFASKVFRLECPGCQHRSEITATELMVAWNLAFVARFSHQDPDPVVAVGATWRRMVDDLGAILDTDTSVITCVDTVADAAEAIAARLS